MDDINEFEANQWWLIELDNMVVNGTGNQKRAVAVVRNLLNTHLEFIGSKDNEKLSASLKSNYGNTDVWFTFRGVELTDGTKRLMTVLITSLGTGHPAIDDLTALIFGTITQPTKQKESK